MSLAYATVLLVMAVGAFRPPSAAAQTCAERDTIGLDVAYSSSRDSLPPAFLGMSIGETFYATDTLISSFTVWRKVDPDVHGVYVRLWVTETEDGGPNSDAVIYEGPIELSLGDSEPVPMRFVFDPPLALPGRGLYYIGVQDPCSLYFELFTSYADRVPGRWFRTTRTNLMGCGLTGVDGACPTCDLCYQLVFCRDAAVPVQGMSWGKLKTMYR